MRKNMYHSVRAILAASLLVTSSGIASAVPARVETDLNVRTGPSTGYGIIDVLPGGAIVDVLACYEGWCEVVWDGFDGFASRAYLDIPQGVAVLTPPASAVVVPGIVVYEERYFRRPVWARSGRIIRQAVRREIREERREDRRDARQDRRENRQESRQENRRENRQENRAERRQENRAEARQEQRQRQIKARRDRRENAADARRERRRDAAPAARRQQQNQARQQRSSERPSAQARGERRQENRQERRTDRSKERQERRKTTGQGR